VTDRILEHVPVLQIADLLVPFVRQLAAQGPAKVGSREERARSASRATLIPPQSSARRSPLFLLLNRPELIEVARRNATAEGIAQVVHPVDRHRKRELAMSDGLCAYRDCPWRLRCRAHFTRKARGLQQGLDNPAQCLGAQV
jgi:hypothetical protein